MGLMDKILDKMSLNSEDDEEFDNEDYMDDYEEEEELPRNPFRRKERVKEVEPPAPKEKPAKKFIKNHTNLKIIQKAGIIRHGSMRNKTKFN